MIFKQLLQAGAADVLTIDACRVAGVNENVAILLLAAKYGVAVCPHAGGVGLCEMVQHLAMFDFVAVAATTADRVLEYVDHLHEHFTDPVRVAGGRYLAPTAPGFSATLRAAVAARLRVPPRCRLAAAGRHYRPVTSCKTSRIPSPLRRAMRLRRRLAGTAALAAAGLLAAACSSGSSSSTAASPAGVRQRERRRGRARQRPARSRSAST